MEDIAVKYFPYNFKHLHAEEQGVVVAYRFMFRTTDSSDVRVAFRIGTPSDIQAFADFLCKSDDVINAAAEYQYSIDMKHFSQISPIKSQDDTAEEV